MDEVVAGGPCKRCGRNPAAGFAKVLDDWHCHDEPTDPRLGTCYEQACSELADTSTVMSDLFRGLFPTDAEDVKRHS